MLVSSVASGYSNDTGGDLCTSFGLRHLTWVTTLLIAPFVFLESKRE